MKRYEASSPSPDNLRQMFSMGDEELSVEDGLVYIALGFHEDTDYTGLVRQAVYMNGIGDVARAEARLQVIYNHDERTPGYAGYLADSEKVHDRLLAIDTLLDSLGDERRRAFIDEMETEIHRIEAQQFAVDNGLSDLDK